MDKKDLDDILKPKLTTVKDGIIYFMTIDDLHNPKYEFSSDSDKELIEIKSNWIEEDLTPLRLYKNRVHAASHSFNISFKIAAKAARKLNRQLRKAFKPKTPYQVWGNGYKNVSLRKKIVLKKILIKANKTL